MRPHGTAGHTYYSSRSDFTSSPPTLEHLSKLRGKLLTPFVQARICTRSDELAVKTVGKLKDVQSVIDRLDADPGNTFIKREDSLLLSMCILTSTDHPQISR